GITPPSEEPELWIGQVLRSLEPAPRHVPKAWRRDDGRVVAVVWVDPVDAPRCMTPQGQIYERVWGETLPVRDPARLDALFRRGRGLLPRRGGARVGHRRSDPAGVDRGRSVGHAPRRVRAGATHRGRLRGGAGRRE